MGQSESKSSSHASHRGLTNAHNSAKLKSDAHLLDSTISLDAIGNGSGLNSCSKCHCWHKRLVPGGL